MPITYDDHLAAVSGRIGAEECQDLMTWIQSHPQGEIDLSACEHLHAAGLQCLMALKPAIRAESSDPRLNAAIKVSPQPADSLDIAQEVCR